MVYLLSIYYNNHLLLPLYYNVQQFIRHALSWLPVICPYFCCLHSVTIACLLPTHGLSGLSVCFWCIAMPAYHVYVQPAVSIAAVCCLHLLQVYCYNCHCATLILPWLPDLVNAQSEEMLKFLWKVINTCHCIMEIYTVSEARSILRWTWPKLKLN